MWTGLETNGPPIGKDACRGTPPRPAPDLRNCATWPALVRRQARSSRFGITREANLPTRDRTVAFAEDFMP